MPVALVQTLAKKTKKSPAYVEGLWNEIKADLLKQGMSEEEKRFYPYLVTILKKRLKINESSLVLKRFKVFLAENHPAK